VAGALSLAPGDVLTLLAALCYSAATVRLPVWSVRRSVSPLELAAGKCAVLTAVAVAAAGVQAGQLTAAGHPISDLWPGWHRPEGWGIMLWAAVGPGALANVLLVKV
jgi:drug/metabolite transporter (DMT)-like permease